MQKGSKTNPLERKIYLYRRPLFFWMKFSLVLLYLKLLVISVLYAGNSKGQALDIRLNMELSNTSIKESLNVLAKKTNVSISYRDDLISAYAKKVNINLHNGTARQVLNRILESTDLIYHETETDVFVTKKTKQSGLSGFIFDSESKAPMAGVSIRLKGYAGSSITDAKGYFQINAPQESGILILQHLGYEKQEVKYERSAAPLRIVMRKTAIDLREVTVNARKKVNTEAALLEERRLSSTIQDGISAEMMERTASITTTQALQRVTGVTITDEKYVAVRGLGERSVIGQLNGVRLASSNPDRSAIPLDLIPAALLDNITVYKTATPDKPADAASAIVELKTKSIPDSITLEFSAQTGFNSNIGFGGRYNSFENSNMGIGGQRINKKNLQNDFLALSEQYPNGLNSIQKLITDRNYSPEAWQEVNRINGIMQRFDPTMTTQYKQAQPNQIYSLTFGNSYKGFGAGKVGVILGGNYYKRFSDIYQGQLTQYSIYQGVVTGNLDVYSHRNIPNFITPNRLYMGRYQNYVENTGTETLNYGILAGVAYRFNPRHELAVQYMGSWGGENKATNMNGSYEYTNLPGSVNSYVYALQQAYRKLDIFNFQGEHKFGLGKFAPRLSYNGATSRSSQNEPDYRFASLAVYRPDAGGYYNRPYFKDGTTESALTYSEHLYALTSGYVNGYGTYGVIQAEPNGRRWRDLQEKNYNYKADLAIPFTLFDGNQEFKTGINYLFRDRTFSENHLLMPGSNFAGNRAIPIYDVNGDLNRLVGPEIVGVKPAGLQGESGMPIGGFIYNSQKSPNNYKGYYETNAFYGMLDLRPTEKLRVTGGVRFEMTNIGSRVDTTNVFLDPGLTATSQDGKKIPMLFIEPNSLYRTGYKPFYSVNVTYNPKEKMNVRVAYNSTLARPELREITNVFEFDAFQMGLVVGNPNLKNQYTQNLDFRWEWFPNTGEVLAISAFGKQIDHQLIRVFNLKTNGLAATYPEFPTIQYQNDQNTGYVWGVEFEVVKQLESLWTPLKGFSLGSNLMLAQSNIKKSDERYLANKSLDRHTPKNSPLFEQAPYSINAWLNYTNKKWGTDLTGTFNMVGERLVQINLTGEPDLYSRPFPMVDFVITQHIYKRVNFKGYAKNILNPAIKTVYANPGTGGLWYNNEYINRSYQRGMEVVFGVTYNVF